MIKTRPKKSTENINNIQAEQQNVKIKNKTECIGLADKNTKKPQRQDIISKKKCKLNITTTLKFFEIELKDNMFHISFSSLKLSYANSFFFNKNISTAAINGIKNKRKEKYKTVVPIPISTNGLSTGF
jgi:hypothetical protein